MTFAVVQTASRTGVLGVGLLALWGLLGPALTVGLGEWLWCQLRGATTSTQLLLLLALGAFGLQAMLELPTRMPFSSCRPR